ncbi:Glycoprotein endo-alpha-1,2-mannosidase [Merluccius polli]|uniref:Glycoprotein endo-alpha-1,2-mannosidase n=1 Tax=Merluccius polli TaxID=89951 RepID=A0AA47NX53_MERPO|nr:Glycoprotein endo-alpha-1,2-mannosidase [Merluccius polli]
MARLRRRTCAAAVLALLSLVLLVAAVLKTMAPPAEHDPLDLQLFPHQDQDQGGPAQGGPGPGPGPADPPLGSRVEETASLKRFPPPNYDLHAFYYAWYGNPAFDGKYVHWDHPQMAHWDPKVAQAYPRGRHSPPDDIGANFYPALGAYSSRDPAVLEAHMQQLRTAAIGVIAVSWYPPGLRDDNGEPVDDIVALLMNAAHKYSIMVAFHIEPYKDRDETSMLKNVKYIVDTYGRHPAFFRHRTASGKVLPLFYVYDSYLLNSEQWARLLKHTESTSVRDTPYDAVFLALMVEEKHKRDILTAGFDGLYTYFATNGFSYGSTQRHWESIAAFCEDNGLLFVPSVGPGYADTGVRPWNFQNTRNRINGKYYENALSAALQAKPRFISITSFNEWHEGTQIEMAVPKAAAGPAPYLDYLPNRPAVYLEITRKWAAIFGSERQRWRD